jgi:hypothetical protein
MYVRRLMGTAVLVAASCAALSASGAAAADRGGVASSAPSSGFQAPRQSFRPQAVPPREVRHRAATALRAAGRSAEARRALRPRVARAALAGSGATFYVRLPHAGTCFFGFSSGQIIREISIAPPIVYALDQPSQYVYWSGFVYNFTTGATTWPATPTFQQAIATQSTAATFAGNQAVRLTGGGTQAIGVNVYWWSGTRGWLSGSAWDLPMWVGQQTGLTYSGATNNRC